MTYSKFYMITQNGKIDCSKEEKAIIAEMGINDYFIHPEVGNAIFKNMDDAIAVAKALIKRIPQLNLAVVEGISGGA